VFLKLGHSSLFRYAVSELRLGENVALSLITVARRSLRVPALHAQLQAGALTLSNAKRVSSVITPENQAEWIERACTLSSRKLEREVARVRPQEATPERASYVGQDRVRLELGLSEREMLRLRRVQDLLSQSRGRAVSLEETIGALTGEFLKRHDPVEKAQRHQVRKGPKSQSDPVHSLVTRREPIPASILHQVNLRDQRRCTQTLTDGTRCQETRWIQIHHKIPVHQGGPNTLENLTTLCSGHHRLQHLAG
jgi:hypothetical protein